MFETTDSSSFAIFEDFMAIVVNYRIVKTGFPHLGFNSHAAVLIESLKNGVADRSLRGSSIAPPKPTLFRGRRIPINEVLDIGTLPYESMQEMLSHPNPFPPDTHTGLGMDLTHCICDVLVKNRYTAVDFEPLFRRVFPNGSGGLEAYEWRTRQKNVYPRSHSWREPEYRTVYDPGLGRYVFFAALVTD